MVVDVGDGDRKIAVGEDTVLVLDILVAEARDRGENVLHERGPSGRDPPQRYRPVIAVQRPAEVLVALELAEERQHAVPVPAGGTAACPFVVVARQPAHRHHAVDRGGAADGAPLGVAPARTRVGRVAGSRAKGRGQARPREARIRMRGGGEAVEEFRRLAAGRVILAGLDQQHAVGGALAQPVGEDAAGRTGAEDDVIVLLVGRHGVECCLVMPALVAGIHVFLWGSM